MCVTGVLPDVSAWPELELIRPLAGGARNVVFLARRGSHDYVVLRSGRPTESLDWELDLLDYLDEVGAPVPHRVATADGRRHSNGVVVERFVSGDPPCTRHDRQRVIDALAAVHEATAEWPQRPGFASSRDLMTGLSGGDVRLDAMPANAVAAVRVAWRPVASSQPTVIHGDPGPSNVVMADGAPVLLDWDEARVDAPAFDFADFDDDVAVPCRLDRQTLRTAGVAWEAATCWTSEPDYAAARLAELHRRQ